MNEKEIEEMQIYLYAKANELYPYAHRDEAKMEKFTDFTQGIDEALDYLSDKDFTKGKHTWRFHKYSAQLICTKCLALTENGNTYDPYCPEKF